MRLIEASTITIAVVMWLAAPALAQTPGAASRLPVDVTGAAEIDYDANTQQYAFRGSRVLVVRGTQRLEAPEILYDGSARRAVLPRGGTLSTPTMELSADRITADLAGRRFVAEGNVAGRLLDGGTWTRLSAARLAADDRPDVQRAEASGDVIAVRSDEELRGDRIVYDRLTKHGTVEGHAALTRGPDRLRADRIIVNLGTDDAEAAGHVLLDRNSQGMHASGDLATYSGRTRTAVLSGRVSVLRGKDALTADRITVQLDRNEAIADGHVRIVAYPKEGTPGAQP